MQEFGLCTAPPGAPGITITDDFLGATADAVSRVGGGGCDVLRRGARAARRDRRRRRVRLVLRRLRPATVRPAAARRRGPRADVRARARRRQREASRATCSARSRQRRDAGALDTSAPMPDGARRERSTSTTRLRRRTSRGCTPAARTCDVQRRDDRAAAATSPRTRSSRPSQIPFTRASGAFNPGAASITPAAASCCSCASSRKTRGARARARAVVRRRAHRRDLGPAGDRRARRRTRSGASRTRASRTSRTRGDTRSPTRAIRRTGRASASSRPTTCSTPRALRRHGPRIAGRQQELRRLSARRSTGEYVDPPSPDAAHRVRRASRRSRTSGRTTARRSSARSPGPGGARASAPARRRSARDSAGCFRSTARRPSRKATSTRWAGACSTSTSPETVRYVSDAPALVARGAVRDRARAAFRRWTWRTFTTGVRVVFPQGLVERGDDLARLLRRRRRLRGAARVDKEALVDSLERAIARGEGGVPL